MLHSYMIPSGLCTRNISWKYVGLVVKHPREMSLKYRISVGSTLYQKIWTPKLYDILKKIIIMGMIYMQTQQN